MRVTLAAWFVAGLASAATAGATTLPLNRGTYVMADTPCRDAPFAAMRSWDGTGLGDPHSHGCRAAVRKVGARYRLLNDCINAGVGPAPRSVERLTLTVTSRDGFAIGGTRYRRCPHGTD